MTVPPAQRPARPVSVILITATNGEQDELESPTLPIVAPEHPIVAAHPSVGKGIPSAHENITSTSQGF